MRPRLLSSSKVFCAVYVPPETLILLPREKVFVPVWRYYPARRRGDGYVIEVPPGTVLRIGKTPRASYYLVDTDEVVRLEGIRAKAIGYNVWAWHYVDPRTKRKVVTVYFDGEKFVRLD